MGLLFAGVATGLAGALAFATVHAILIVPIWTRMLNGVPVAIVAGIAIAWAMDETAAARGQITLADAMADADTRDDSGKRTSPRRASDS
ncbi:MAG: hypothetical protein DMF91_17965 [Acidobacteria bacterium]|nr:MAG: hypothetical protein DMF91_17965 [Acidobacteriota bacterium]